MNTFRTQLQVVFSRLVVCSPGLGSPAQPGCSSCLFSVVLVSGGWFSPGVVLALVGFLSWVVCSPGWVFVLSPGVPGSLSWLWFSPVSLAWFWSLLGWVRSPGSCSRRVLCSSPGWVSLPGASGFVLAPGCVRSWVWVSPGLCSRPGSVLAPVRVVRARRVRFAWCVVREGVRLVGPGFVCSAGCVRAWALFSPGVCLAAPGWARCLVVFSVLGFLGVSPGVGALLVCRRLWRCASELPGCVLPAGCSRLLVGSRPGMSVAPPWLLCLLLVLVARSGVCSLSWLVFSRPGFVSQAGVWFSPGCLFHLWCTLAGSVRVWFCSLSWLVVAPGLGLSPGVLLSGVWPLMGLGRSGGVCSARPVLFAILGLVCSTVLFVSPGLSRRGWFSRRVVIRCRGVCLCSWLGGALRGGVCVPWVCSSGVRCASLGLALRVCSAPGGGALLVCGRLRGCSRLGVVRRSVCGSSPGCVALLVLFAPVVCLTPGCVRSWFGSPHSGVGVALAWCVLSGVWALSGGGAPLGVPGCVCLVCSRLVVPRPGWVVLLRGVSAPGCVRSRWPRERCVTSRMRRDTALHPLARSTIRQKIQLKLRDFTLRHTVSHVSRKTTAVSLTVLSGRTVRPQPSV
uniref:Uncharacterized protein n=1 Tax=Knipowitschia caucasica TaxID=637954 RepID=A0AAV2KKY7_KNICA